MGKVYTVFKNKTRVVLFTVFFVILGCLKLSAQIDIVIGTGTTGNTNTTYPCPLQDFYEGSRMQYLYLASELTSAGMGPGTINSIKYEVLSLATTTVSPPLFAMEQLTVSISTSSVSTLATNAWEPAGTVVFGPVDYTAVVGVNTLTFSTPFFWNGTDNIVIEICNGDPANTSGGAFYTGNPVIPWTTGLSFNGSHSYRADNLGNLCGTATTTNTGTQTTRPNITFDWTPAAACSGTPLAGSAISDKVNVCLGEPFTLSIVGSTVASGLTYQWQSSPDNTTWTNISGATSFNFATAQSVSTYYRCIVTCTSGGASSNSTSIQVVSPLAVSGSFFINSGVPTGGGSFQTFAEAISYISCGINGPVVFNVVQGSGPYNEQVVIPQINGASSVNTVTFKGNLATLLFNSTNSSDRAGILFNGADHIIIDSLIIDGSTGTYAWGIVMTNQADSNIISNCTVNIGNVGSSSTNFIAVILNGSASSTAVSGNNGNGNLFENNTITGGYYGFYLYGSSSANNSDNKVINNTIQDNYSYANYIVYQSNAVVSGNNISRPTRTNSTTTAGAYLSTNSVNALIEKNRIHNMFDAFSSSTSTCYGVYVGADGSPGQENKVFNNIIYNIGGNGAVYGIYNTGGDYMQAYHNTVSLDDVSATSGAAYGLYQTTTATGVEYLNNISYVSRSGTGTKRCIYFNTTTSSIVSNNNVLYLNAGSGTNNNLGQFGTTNYATLPDWQTANSGAYDMQSVGVDPMFVNPGSGNYTPSSSLVDNIGVGLSVTTDILGNSRSLTTPDPGAYEFSNLVAGLNMGAEALITPDQSPVDCYGSSEVVTIRIRNSSTATIDFAINPVTVTANVNGPLGLQTLSVVLSAGTLASDATMDVPLSGTLDMTAPGTYTFNANTSVTGDVYPVNDVIIPVDRIRAALDPGTVVATPDVFCVIPGAPMLSTSNETAATSYQWQQSSTSGSGFADIPGATTSSFAVASPITQAMYYRLIVGCSGSFSTSPEVSVIISNPEVLTTTGATRCGPGDVALSATSSPGTTLSWYADASGGSELGTGNSFTPNVSASTTYYVEANQAGGGGATPLLITELNIGDPDGLEIQNVSGSAVDVTGWKVAISDSYTDINVVNSIVQVLSGVMNPGEIKTWSDVTGSNYWGNNIFWNPGSFPGFAGWAAILDNNNNLVDVVFLNWPASNIQAATVTVGTTTITVGSQWSGNGIDITTVATTASVSRQGTNDNNDATDFSIITSSLNATNPGMTIPFSGFGCSSPRVAVTATVNPPPAFEITQDTTVCNSSITPLLVTSTIADFDSYTWSPVAGLYTDATATTPYTGGSASIVYAKLSAEGVYKYYTSASNSSTSCANIDSVTLTVLPAAISISATPAELCVSGSTTLTIPSANYGASLIQWFSSPDGITYTPVAGATSTTYTTPTISSTTYYKVEIGNGSGNVCLQPDVIITVNNPQVLSTTSGSRCGPGIVTLTATGSAGATLNWYTDAVGGSPVGTGNTFVTPSLTSSATYYAAASNGGGGLQYVGAPDLSIGSPLVVGTYYLNFTLSAAATIQSVECFFSGTVGAPFVINIRDAATSASVFTYSGTVSVTGTSTAQVIPLNATLPPGNYQIGWTTDPGTYRTSSGASYPYTIPGIISITGNTFNDPNYYYYFYHWAVVTGCESARIPVDAVIAENTVVTADPVDQAVCPGTMATFSVSATGGTLTYQWRKDGVDISGATSINYIIPNASSADLGTYDVIVTGDCSSDTSNTANLALKDSVAITSQPGDIAACEGQVITFNVMATGSGTLTYQWQKDGIAIPGATSPVYVVSGVSANTIGNYNVVVSGDCDSVTSNTFILSLKAPTAIVTPPADQSVCAGNNVTLSVGATGAGTLSYQWQKDGTDITGATSSDYNISGATASDVGSYTVTVTGECGSVTSTSVNLTITAVTVIGAQPVSQTVCAGDNATFSVTATGSNISYQWKKGTADITGATSATLTINGATAADAASYSVVITGDCGTITSTAVNLVVNAPGTWTGAVSNDWNNPANWCGGVPTSSTDAMIPSSAPNMPNLSGAGAVKNITITNGGSLTINIGGVLDLYGNISGGGTFTATNGAISFRGISNQSVPGFTATDVTMNGAGGLTLGGNTGITGTLTLTMGNITLGSNNLSLATGSIGSIGSHIITNGNGHVIATNFAASQNRMIPVSPDNTSYNPVLLEANAGHATDDITISVQQGVPENGTSGAMMSKYVVDRTWIINEATPGGSNVNITLQWDIAQELTDFDHNECYVMQYNGTAWIPGVETAANGNGPYSQTKMNVTSFSSFAVQTEPIPDAPTGIFPNPTASTLNVVLRSNTPENVTMQVYDASGKLVKVQKESIGVGGTLLSIDVSKLSAGIYLLKVSIPRDREFLVRRFLKVN